MAKAQKGDLIRIVNAGITFQSYSNGDIFEVVKSKQSSVLVNAYWNGGEEIEINRILVTDDEYEIHRKAGEEDVCSECSGKFIDGIYDGKFCSRQCQAKYTGFPIEEFSDETSQDAVNSPNHYTQGRFETIEIIGEITQGYSDGYVAYCVGNALKYLARAPFKHGDPTEDLAKAGAYINFALERLQTEK